MVEIRATSLVNKVRIGIRCPRSASAILSLLMMAALAWLYSNEIVPKWEYAGFDGYVDLTSLLIALLFAALCGFLLPSGLSTRSLILSVVHYGFVIPSIAIACFGKFVPAYFFSFALAYFLLFFSSMIRLRAVSVANISPRIVLSVGVGILGAGVLLYIAFGGLATFNLNLERVYEFRRDSAERLPAVFGYFYSNLASAVIPLCLALAFILKARLSALLVIVLAILLFGMTHHKSVFFSTLIAIAFFLVFRSRNPVIKVGLLFVVLCVLAVIEVLLYGAFFGGDLPGIYSSYFIRRTLLVPSLADRAYVEFFLSNPYFFWAQSKITFGLVISPSDVTVPFLIGREYFGDADLAANAGFVGSGYANAGVGGVALYGLILGLIVAIVDSFGRRIGAGLVAAVCLLPVITMVTSTDVVTALLSHGVLLLLISLSVTGRFVPCRT